MKTYLVWACLVVNLLFSFNLYANLPKDERVPGGVAVIPLNVISNTLPKVMFDGQRVAVVKKHPNLHISKENPWVAIVGIPISQLPGIANLTIEDEKTSPIKQQFTITDKSYPTEYLEFKSTPQKPEKAPTAAELAAEEKLARRIVEEKKILDAAYTFWNVQEIPTFQLEWPLKGRISGLYGARRVINGKPRKHHTGIDIAAPTGTPIQTSAKGKVINTGKYYFTGNTVVVDHGLGFKTIYCHLDKIKVKNGDQLHKNQILGTVGKTGRATGPHLHFGVSLNNQRVSPELFLPK